LPTCKGSLETVATSREQSLIWRDGEAVCFRMMRRKNRPRGSGILRRVCSCSGGPHTCTLHQLWYGFFEELPVGCCPWKDITAAKARERLRQTLGRLGVNQAESYGTQDFRRGHAEVCYYFCGSISMCMYVAAGYEKIGVHSCTDFTRWPVEVVSISALY